MREDRVGDTIEQYQVVEQHRGHKRISLLMHRQGTCKLRVAIGYNDNELISGFRLWKRCKEINGDIV